MTKYDDDDIEQLKGAERVRKRPEALLGSKGLDGAKHVVTEIVGNALDEFSSGYGDKLDISVEEDGTITVRDYGRGVPLGYNEKAKAWNWFLIYSELYAGGKYGDSQKELKKITKWSEFDSKKFSYLFSVGLNGLGGAATQYSSEHFSVTSYREGTSLEMRFERGESIWKDLKSESTTEPNGTRITWKPDDTVFTDVDIPLEWFRALCENISYIAGIEVNFTADSETTTFAARRVVDMLTKHIKVDRALQTEGFHHEIDDRGDVCVLKFTIAFGAGFWGNRYFHNQVEIGGGVHSDSRSSAEREFFREAGRAAGVNLIESDYTGLLSFVVSSYSNKVSYRGQTKDSLDDRFIFNGLYNHIVETLRLERKKGTPWVQSIVNTALERAEERAKLADMRKTLALVSKAQTKKAAPEAFTSCTLYDRKKAEEVELWICEGKSAMGSIKASRDSMFQCIYPVRGKSLNVFKSPLERILANEEIKGLINILGCGVDLGSDDHDTFNINKLRVGKVIFASDGDVDGFHIRMLLFLIFYKLFPQLLHEGRVYIAETPRYGLDLKNGQGFYCRDERDLEETIEKNGGRGQVKYIHRYKGLGQVNPEVLRLTTVDPKTRDLIQIKVDPNDTDVYNTLEVLFGQSTDLRKREILDSLLGGGVQELFDSLAALTHEIDNTDHEQERELVEVVY